jgi:hypothetical protein
MQRTTLSVFAMILTLFLLHSGAVFFLWGSGRYTSTREKISSLQRAALSKIGLPNGPQFLRLVSTTPEQCPESAWLASLVLSTLNLISLLMFLYYSQYSYAARLEANFSKDDDFVAEYSPRESMKDPKNTVKRQKSLSDFGDLQTPRRSREIRHISSTSNMSDYASNPTPLLMSIDSEKGDVNESNSIEPIQLKISLSHANLKNLEDRPDDQSTLSIKDKFASKYSLASVIATYIICTLCLDAFFSLILPSQSLGTYPTAKSSCLFYEKRFNLSGYGDEYIDTVIIIAYILLHCSWRYSRSNFIRIVGMSIAFGTFTLVWLTVDCAYILLIVKFVITYFSWEYLVPRNIQSIASLVNDNEGKEVVI